MSREISWVRPPTLPLTDSREERCSVARGLVPGQTSQSRRIRGGRHGLVQEDEAGGIDDDGISLASAHERDGGH